MFYRDEPVWLVRVANQATQQAGQVEGDVVQLHRTEINDSGDFVSGEQDMIMPDVSDNWLQNQRLIEGFRKLLPAPVKPSTTLV